MKEKSLSDQLIAHPKDLQVHASLAILAKDVANILEKNFPGWAWAIEPDEFGQVINIKNLNLHDEWGYTIRTAEIHNDPRRRLAYVAGQEILNRFGMEARGIGGQADRLALAMRDAKGRVVPLHAYDRMNRQQREKHNIEEQAYKIMRIVEDHHG